MVKQKAQSKARTLLSRTYNEEFKELLEIEKNKQRIRKKDSASVRNVKFAKARSRALTRLTHEFASEYKKFYAMAVRQGYVRAYPTKKKEVHEQ